jgi:uncharacterized Zn-finger protein
MADRGIPHFHNEPGAEVIRVGAREFMCIGALPPFDHPHIFIDMGGGEDVLCSYCATRFVYDAALQEHEARPPACVWDRHAPAA